MTAPVHSHAHLCWRPAKAQCAPLSGQPWTGLRSVSPLFPTQPTFSTESTQKLSCPFGKAVKATLPQALLLPCAREVHYGSQGFWTLGLV